MGRLCECGYERGKVGWGRTELLGRVTVGGGWMMMRGVGEGRGVLEDRVGDGVRVVERCYAGGIATQGRVKVNWASRGGDGRGGTRTAGAFVGAVRREVVAGMVGV